jgi:hypothetical protein
MPWTPGEFKEKHAHHLSDKQAQVAATVANEVLTKTGDDGKAVREGIAAGERAMASQSTRS